MTAIWLLVVFPLKPVTFVCCKSDILDDVVMLLQLAQELFTWNRLQFFCAPAIERARPAISTVIALSSILLMLDEDFLLCQVVLECMEGADSCDGPSNVPFQLIEVFVHCRELKAGVAE